MLHFSPRAFLLCVEKVLSQYRGSVNAGRSPPHYSRRNAHNNGTAAGSKFTGRNAAASCRSSTDCIWFAFWKASGSKWGGYTAPLSRTISSCRMLTSSRTQRHDPRESALSLHTLVQVRGPVRAFTPTARSATRDTTVYCQDFPTNGCMPPKPLNTAALPVVRIGAPNGCAAGKDLGKQKSAASPEANITAVPVPQCEERPLGEAGGIAQGPSVCATNIPAARSDKQGSGQRLTTGAAFSQENGAKQTLTTGRKASAAALHDNILVSGDQVCGVCASAQLTPGLDALFAQPPDATYYKQQRRANIVRAPVASAAASEKENGLAARAWRSECGERGRVWRSLQLSLGQRKRSRIVTAICCHAEMRTRYTYDVAHGTRVGTGYPCAFFQNHLLTASLRDGNEKPTVFETPPSRGSRSSKRFWASGTTAQNPENRSAAASLPKHEGEQQKENGRDGTREQRIFQPSPPSQALLGLLAALGACISLLLLYERSLLDSAALLYGAWDPEWDASWRTSAQQYEAEMIAKGAQAQPSATPNAAAGGGEVSTGPLRPPTRQVILVRHGQYRIAGTDEERSLTDLGARQAAATGRRLRDLLQGQRVQAIVHSNMKRAQETASIIQEVGCFKAVPLVEDALLAEGAPTEPIPSSDMFWPSPTDIALDGPRIEKAFRRYFYRARIQPTALPSSCPSASGTLCAASQAMDTTLSNSAKSTADNARRDVQNPQRPDSFIVIVCHGNVIRYFLMRALQLPACAWLRWALFNTGLTWLSIDANGRVSCRCFGDVGHLPTHMISYN